MQIRIALSSLNNRRRLSAFLVVENQFTSLFYLTDSRPHSGTPYLSICLSGSQEIYSVDWQILTGGKYVSSACLSVTAKESTYVHFYLIASVIDFYFLCVFFFLFFILLVSIPCIGFPNLLLLLSYRLPFSFNCHSVIFNFLWEKWHVLPSSLRFYVVTSSFIYGLIQQFVWKYSNRK